MSRGFSATAVLLVTMHDSILNSEECALSEKKEKKETSDPVLTRHIRETELHLCPLDNT